MKARAYRGADGIYRVVRADTNFFIGNFHSYPEIEMARVLRGWTSLEVYDAVDGNVLAPDVPACWTERIQSALAAQQRGYAPFYWIKGCSKCGKPVASDNDTRLIQNLFQNGRVGGTYTFLTYAAGHLLPEDGCEGSPSRYQYLEGMPRDTREDYPYIPEYESRMRAAYTAALRYAHYELEREIEAQLEYAARKTAERLPFGTD